MAGKRQAAKGKGKKQAMCGNRKCRNRHEQQQQQREEKQQKPKQQQQREQQKAEAKNEKANMKHDEVRIDERGDARRGRYLARCEREETRKRFKYCVIDGKYIDE